MKKSLIFLTLFLSILSINGQNDPMNYFLLTDTVIEEGAIFYSNDIYWDLSAPNIRSECDPLMDSIIVFMKNNPNLIIEIGVHTDYRCPVDFNDDLSKRRAESFKDFCIYKGVKDSSLIAKGYGERKPYFVTEDINKEFRFLPKGQILDEEFIKSLRNVDEQEVAHSYNRRVELKIIKSNK